MDDAFSITSLVRDRADMPGAGAAADQDCGGSGLPAPEPDIHRRTDGSIDHDHYDRIARNLRAHDLCAALSFLFAPLGRIVRHLGATRVSGMRSLGRGGLPIRSSSLRRLS